MVTMADALAITVVFNEGRADVAVAGELDMLSAPSLHGTLIALVDNYSEVVVDLGAVTFMDAHGADVFTRVAQRAATAGATLMLRSTPPAVRRVLDVTEVSSLLVYDTTALPHNLAVEGAALQPPPESVDVSAQTSRQIPMTRPSTDVIDAALRLVTALAAATLTNADGASVTLERHGRLMTVAATDDAVKTMDQHQYDTGEGPCLAAKADGSWHYIEELADEARWPNFVPLALEQGIHSILASPLMTHDRPQGSLNIYSSIDKAFGTHEQELAALFATQASEILTAADEGVTEEQSNKRFTEALEARQAIHRAQGAIMARNQLDAARAIASMISDARSNGTTVLVQALAIIASLDSSDCSE